MKGVVICNMKHGKEWRFCDRCGVEIKIKPKNVIKFVRIGEYSDFEPTFEDGETSGMVEKIHTFKFLNRKYDLCPKCRKDFERFMIGL